MTTTTSAVAAASTDALPKARVDIYPLLLVPVLVLLALPLVGSFSTWVTLTVAGLAMGAIIFVMASGMSLIFGLMHVLNFGHVVFFTLGAFLTTTIVAAMPGLVGSPNVSMNVAAMVLIIIVAMAVVACAGWIFERVIVRPTRGDLLKQILTTMGGMIIGGEILKTIWGTDPIVLPPPLALQGSFLVSGAILEKYRLTAAAFGLIVFGALLWVLNHTKIGLLVRAGAQNREMVESLGYRIQRLFVGVFMAGAALAGLGGVLWGFYQQTVDPEIGAPQLLFAIIVIVIGGMGSTGGCFIGALLIGLLDNYVGFLAPKVTTVSTILLMVLILLWRPQGLYPVVKH